jgi:hypothetical protein
VRPDAAVLHAPGGSLILACRPSFAGSCHATSLRASRLLSGPRASTQATGASRPSRLSPSPSTRTWVGSFCGAGATRLVPASSRRSDERFECSREVPGVAAQSAEQSCVSWPTLLPCVTPLASSALISLRGRPVRRRLERACRLPARRHVSKKRGNPRRRPPSRTCRVNTPSTLSSTHSSRPDPTSSFSLSMIEAKPLPSAAPHGQPSTSNQLPPVAVDALPLASARPIKRLRQVKPLPSRAASIAPRPASPAPGPSPLVPRPPPPPPPPPPPAERPSDEDGRDELALALYRVVTGTSTPSPKPAATAVLPDISTASVISASVAMSPAATTATLVTSDEESVKTADHLPSASTVAAQLRSMFRRAETAGEEVASDPARLFDCLASDPFMNGPEDDAAVDGCSHPHSVWKELDGSSSEPASQSIARIHFSGCR